MRGVYQHCDERHLHRYLAEFDYRHNNRVALGVDDKERAERLLRGVKGRRLTYKQGTQRWVDYATRVFIFLLRLINLDRVVAGGDQILLRCRAIGASPPRYTTAGARSGCCHLVRLRSCGARIGQPLESVALAVMINGTVALHAGECRADSSAIQN